MNTTQELTEDIKNEMFKHNVYTQDKIVEQYNECSANYEKVYLTAGWHDPLKCAELAHELVGENAEHVKVIDFGCGTGLVGHYLAERGFKYVEGVDACPGMIEQASKKNVYAAIHELFLGKPETFPNKFYGAFDIVTASGILAEGHLDCSVFDEMLLALKEGGHAIFATRTMYLSMYGYQEKMNDLVE